MKKDTESNIFLNIIKMIIVVALISAQLYVMYILLTGTKTISNYYNGIFTAVTLIAVVSIVCKQINPSYKIAWIVFIMFLPIPGILLYLLWGNNKVSKRDKRLLYSIDESVKDGLIKDDNLYKEIKSLDKTRYNQINYLTNVTGYPVHKCESIEYLNLGEEYFRRMLEDIKKAERYIFIEYFIISKGNLWDEIFEILKEKVKLGVKIYIITDEIGSILRYPKNFKKEMKELGIELIIFNPITPIITSYINYRDHRKITVIDGIIAYSGGLNIGDEYINKEVVHGHWKDTGIRITGTAINNYIIMFIKAWNLYNKQKLDYKNYIFKKSNDKPKGYIIPYGDGPNNKDNPAENIYMNMINTAKDYIYITTPYLILDNEMITALSNAAKSGVDVRIITPHIGDKWFVHMVTRSFYYSLLEAGVKIYEYEPGFIHAKTFVSDDEISIVGTINLDFRSLYLHYECASYTYKTEVEKDIRNDFIKTQEKSIEIKLEEFKHNKGINKIISSVLKLFAPIM